MDLATQEAATALLGRARETFGAAMDNAGRLDAASVMAQWIEDYDAAFDAAPDTGGA